MYNKLFFLIPLFSNILLISFIQLINTSLATYSISLFVGGLLLAAPLILYPFFSGLICTLLTALYYEATYAPGSNGFLPIVFCIVYTLAFWFRKEFKAYSEWHTSIYLYLINPILFFILAVILGKDSLLSIHFWSASFINLTLSQITVAIIATWFIKIHYSLQSFFSLNQKNTEAV